MIITLAAFAICAFIFTTLGRALVANVDALARYGWADCFFLGLVCAGGMVNIWSLFLPANGNALLFFALLAAGLLFLKNVREYYRQLVRSLRGEPLFVAIAVVFVVVMMWYALPAPKLFDTYLYHLSAVQWAEQYSAVPGLANIQERLGFNSSAFVLSAAFLFNSMFGQYLFVINSLATLVFGLWLLRTAYLKKGVVGIFCLLFLYYFLKQYALHISSPGSDLLPNVLVGFLFIRIIADPADLKVRYLTFLLLPLFCLTLKLSVLPVLLLALGAVLYRFDTRYKSALRYGMLWCALLIGPWLVRNVILTGYLIFPVGSIDLFDPEWKMPQEKVFYYRDLVYSWARVPFRDYREVLAMGWDQWFPIWWKALLPLDKKFFILAAAAPIWGALFFFLKRRTDFWPVLLTLVSSYLGFLFWLNAPDVRFSYAFMLFPALFPIVLLDGLARKISRYINPVVTAGIAVCLFFCGKEALAFFQEDYRHKPMSHYLFKPDDVLDKRHKRGIHFDTQTLYTPGKRPFTFYGFHDQHLQCYDLFPCAPGLSTDIRLRGEDLSDGFAPLK